VLLKEENIFAIQIPHQMEKVMITKVKDDLKKINDIEVFSYVEQVIK